MAVRFRAMFNVEPDENASSTEPVGPLFLDVFTICFIVQVKGDDKDDKCASVALTVYQGDLAGPDSSDAMSLTFTVSNSVERTKADKMAHNLRDLIKAAWDEMRKSVDNIVDLGFVDLHKLSTEKPKKG